jgi:hypothetical protein
VQVELERSGLKTISDLTQNLVDAMVEQPEASAGPAQADEDFAQAMAQLVPLSQLKH